MFCPKFNLKNFVFTFNLVSLLLKHEVRVIHKVSSNVLLDCFICSYFFQEVATEFKCKIPLTDIVQNNLLGWEAILPPLRRCLRDSILMEHNKPLLPKWKVMVSKRIFASSSCLDTQVKKTLMNLVIPFKVMKFLRFM